MEAIKKERKLPLELNTPLKIVRLGFIPYRQAWDIQKELQAKLTDGSEVDTLLLCEHPAVITLGSSASQGNILASTEQLAAQGVEAIKIERGGDVTYHGPGQLVGYPIIDLNRKRRDVSWYMRSLEEVVIRTLGRFGINGVRIPGKTGVWIEQPNASSRNPVIERKIASIGVRISRWRTLHGFAINIFNCKKGFSLINPCGFTDIEVTSIEEEVSGNQKAVTMKTAEDLVIEDFKTVLSFQSGDS